MSTGSGAGIKQERTLSPKAALARQDLWICGDQFLEFYTCGIYTPTNGMGLQGIKRAGKIPPNERTIFAIPGYTVLFHPIVAALS
jgi:hypothetical protein